MSMEAPRWWQGKERARRTQATKADSGHTRERPLQLRSRAPTSPHSRAPNTASTRGPNLPSSSTPSLIISRAPPNPSSAGWKQSFTVPRNEAADAPRTRAAPSSAATCASWPHACMTPGACEIKGQSPVSCRGSASMSARSRMQGPAPPPPRMSATTPVRPQPSTTSLTPGIARSSAATRAAVSCSAKDSSGCAWKWRRNDTIHASMATTSGTRVVGASDAGEAMAVSGLSRVKSPKIISRACQESGLRVCEHVTDSRLGQKRQEQGSDSRGKLITGYCSHRLVSFVLRYPSHSAPPSAVCSNTP